MSRVLIVNADDYGLTPGVCDAVLRAHEQGVVTSTSALVVAPAWAARSRALGSSGIGVGVHFCAVGEDPPLLGASEVPSLVDGRGRLPLTWKQFVRRAAAGRVDPADLRREFAAQLELAQASGARLTHVDSHQNLHHWPSVGAVVLELAGAAGLRAARVARARRTTVAGAGLAVLGRRFERACRRAGVATPAASGDLAQSGHVTVDRFRATVAALGASAAPSAEIALHPGTAADPDRSRYRWGYDWPAELATACDPSAREAVQRAGFRLGDFADLVAVERVRGTP